MNFVRRGQDVFAILPTGSGRPSFLYSFHWIINVIKGKVGESILACSRRLDSGEQVKSYVANANFHNHHRCASRSHNESKLKRIGITATTAIAWGQEEGMVEDTATWKEGERVRSFMEAQKGQERLLHWSSHIPNQQLYGDLPAVSNKIASRRLQLAGHCYRHPELSTQKLVLWEPTHGHRGRGRPNTTYIDTLKRDTGAFEASEIAALMADKRLRKDLVVARLRGTKSSRERQKILIWKVI